MRSESPGPLGDEAWHEATATSAVAGPSTRANRTASETIRPVQTAMARRRVSSEVTSSWAPELDASSSASRR